MADETRLIGAVGIKVRPVTKGFREEIQDELRRLPDGEVKVEVDADTRKAKKKIDEVSEDKVIHLRVDPNWDGLKAAEKQLERELKKLKAHNIPVNIDEKTLKEKIEMLGDFAKRSKVVMKIAHDEDGYKSVLAKIREVQREKLVKEIDFKVDDASLAAEAEKYERLIAEATKPREIKIRYNDDRDSLAEALSTVEAELKKIAVIEIPVTADKESLENTRDSLREMMDVAPIKMRYTQDKAGYDGLLKKIKALKSERAAIDVEVNTDPVALDRLEKDLEEKLTSLKAKSKIKLDVSHDTDKMRKAMAQIDAELAKLDAVEIELELDPERLRQKRRELERELTDSNFELKFSSDPDSLKQAQSKLKEMLRANETQRTLIVDADDDSIKQTLNEIEHMIDEAERDKIKLKVESSGLSVAAGELAWVSRSRTVPFYVRINQKSLAVAEGILKSLSGYNTLSAMGRTIERLVTNFDTILLKTAAISTLVGGVVNGLTYAGTAALGIGDGMSRVVGLLATAPAAVAALSVGVLVNVAAWKNFKGAIDGNEKALAALPAKARAAAVALQGTWTQIQKPTQNNFWDAMGTSLQDMVLTLLPQVKEGFANTATHVGRFAASVADTMRELALAGGLDTTFANIGGMFDRAAGAAKPLTEAISTLGLRGSEYLPQFGQWLTDLSVRFNNFIQEADQMGRINQWIEEGVQSLKDMWSAGDGIIDMLRGITAAAMDAGANDLSTFADNMQRMGEIVQGEPFRSRLATIFEGARAGASALNVGVKDLGLAFGESATFVSDMLTKLGHLGGLTFTNISTLFSGKTFQGGMTAAIDGLLDMVAGLEPAFFNMGKVVGNLGKTAGAAFRGLAPLIDTVAEALADITDKLGGELPDAASTLLRYMSGTFTTIANLVSPLVTALGSILRVFNDMPGGMQTMLLAFGAFTLMRNQISTLFTAMGNTKAFTTLEEKWRQQQMHAGNANSATQRFNAGTASLALARHNISNVGESFRQAGAQADTTAGKIKGVSGVIGGGLMKAGGGLATALGGPWGIAIAAAAVGLSLYAKKQQEAKAAVAEHTGALDDQTGAITRANEDIIAKSIVDDKGHAGIKTSSEVLKELGRSVQATAEAVANGGPAYDNMIGQLDKGVAAANAMASGVDEMGLPIKGNADAWNAWCKQMGINNDAINGIELRALRDQLVAEHDAVNRSVQGWQMRNDKVAGVTGITEGMAASIKVLGDNTADTNKRLEAYRDILDSLNGVSKSAWERQRDLTESGSDMVGFLQEADEWGNRLNTGLVDLSTGFTIHTEAGGRFNDMLSDLQTQALTAGQQAYDMAGGVENAGAAAGAANAAMEPYKQQLQALADQNLLTQDEVNALTKALFGIPGSTPFELTDENSIAYVSMKLTGLHEQIQATPNKEITITEPLSPAVIKGLENLNYKVTHLEDGTIKVTESGTAETGEVISAEARKLRFAAITAQAVTDAASRALDEVANRPRNAYVVMHAQKGASLIAIEADGGLLKNNHVGQMYQAFANGGFNFPVNNVKAYASGGRENHVAQIARSTPSVPIRIWGEEETGGEAYIPLSASKRGRSVSILNQVANQFGYNLSAGGRTFADGGIVHGGSTGGGVAVTIGSYITQHSDTPDDVARAIMRRVKASGAYMPLEAF